MLRVEESAGPPVRPGHASRWGVDVLRPLESLERAWKAHANDREATLRDIEEVDPALAPRVEKLRARGGELGETLADLGRRLREVAERNGFAESEEPYEKTRRIREESLAWVVDARAFEMEVRSWYMEAFQRERGEGD